MEQWILASASPQRKSLLEELGVRFTVIPSGVRESACDERDPVRRAEVLAQWKARDVAHLHPERLVIGCDTLVVSAEGHVLEKPADSEDARRMLRLQSGRTSLVHSGVAVIAEDGTEHSGVSTSAVTFKKLSSQEEDWWIAGECWRDRSGAFQIDGPGQLLIERMEGDWTGVVGLPVFLLGELLTKSGGPLMSC